MPPVGPALEILVKAQADLRELIQQALAEGRYGEVAEIARLADGVARLVSRDYATDVIVEPQSSIPRQAVAGPGSAAHQRRGRLSRTFPRFEREGDKLVKIAWSKKDRAEYEHKAPRQVIDMLIEAIKSRKGVGAKFEAPDVLPLKEPRTRKEVPSYQSYLALAWLRREGVVAKYGRDGYSLKPTAATPEHLAELWEALPSRD